METRQEFWLVETDRGVLHRTDEDSKYYLGGSNVYVALFEDKKEAQRVAKNFKARSKTKWTKVTSAKTVYL